MSLILLLSSLLKVRLAPRGARLASNAGESPHSSAISIVQEPLPSTWREGRRIGDETHILHASNSASSPRENKSEDFSAGPLFSSEAPAVRPRPRQAESDVFYTAENKKQAPRRKKFAMLAQRAFFSANPARQCLPALTPALRVVLRLGQASQRAFFDPFCDVASPPPQGGREAAIQKCFLFGGKKLGKKQTSRTRDRSINQSLANQRPRSYQFVERMPDFSFWESMREVFI